MAKKAKPASKRKTPKTSIVKLSNKRLGKLAKQGKLKKKLRKKEIKLLISQRVNKDTARPVTDPDTHANETEEKEEPDIPLVEADYEYFAKPGRDFGFLHNLEKGDESKKKRKRKQGEDEDSEDDTAERMEEEHARQKKKQVPEKEMKALLPIKTKEKGVIPQMIEKEPVKKAARAEGQPAEEEKPLEPLSTAELYFRRQQKLADMKTEIAVLCSALCEDPQANYRKLKELRLLLETEDPDVSITVKKILMVSLTEVFKDIIPGYRIRFATASEKEQSAKKETKSLRGFEESLVTNYRNFLEFMECVAKCKDVKSKNKKANKGRLTFVDIPEEAKKSLSLLALRCMCDLLATHPHFNFRTEIISAVIPFIIYRDAQPSDVVVSCVKRIFKEDKSGEVTLEVTRLIGRLVKSKHFNVDPKVLKTFLSLRIKEIFRKEDAYKEKKKVKEEKRKIMSRREKKRLKQMGELEKELKEAAVMTDKKKRLRINTEIINVVFLSYFRVLKHAQDSQLLPVVLEGLAKFAHLINIDFFDDLFSVLNELVESEDLTYKESLHCVQTAFTILTGQGEALNIDPMRFYRHLYNTLFMLHAGCSSEDVPLALQCLDTMISKRKKQISQQRLFAYIKRLSVLASQLPAHSALAILSTMRTFMLSDSKTDMLLDTEHEGPGVYMPELDDPEHCNAHNTALYELHYTRRHYHPAVRRYAEHLLKGAPSQGNGSLPGEIARKSPFDLFKDFDASEMDFKPPMPKKPKSTKKVFFAGDFLQDSIHKDVLKVLPEFDDVTEKDEEVTKETAMETDSKANSSQKASSKIKKSKRKRGKNKEEKTEQAAHINIGALQNL